MKILFVITKNKTFAVKTVIYNKRIKRGSINNKRYDKNYDVIELTKLNDSTIKCIITHTRYKKRISIDNFKMTSKGILMDISEFIDINFFKAESFKQELLITLIKMYFEADSNDCKAYQMNLIKS